MSDKATYEIDLKDGFSPKLKVASGGLDTFESKLTKIGGTTGSGGMLGTFSSFAMGAMAGLAASVGLVVTKMISLGSEMEQTKVAMEVLVGDTEKANKLFRDMTQYANVTPFANSDITKAGQTMLAFGTAVEDVMPTMAMLGDVSGGNAEKLQSLTLAYSQMSSTGRLMGQDLLQMINSGFNPLKVISEKTGVSMGDLKKRMEEGAISADLVKEAFIAATSEGGLFYQMTDKQAKTMSGAWSTFMGTLEHGLATFGMKLAPMITGALTGLTKGFDMLARVDFGPFLDAFKQIWDMVTEVGQVFSDLFGPIFGEGLDGMKAMQVAFDVLGGMIRLGLTPLRAFLEGLTLIGKVADNLIEIFKGIGLQWKGLFTLDWETMKEGGLKATNALMNGFKEIKDEISGFAAREVEGWKKVFNGGTSAEETAATATDRFKAGDMSAMLAAAVGAKDKKKKGSGVDGDVRSGGVKNITININKLVEAVNIQDMGDVSMNKAIDIVTRALLTAVNDANLAVS